jgi:hypothetical protein
MKKRKPSKEQNPAKLRLQARVVLRNGHGELFDVTEDAQGYGLEYLGQAGANAAEDLSRVDELLQVLALAAENRPTVEAHLVGRILEEVNVILDQSGELASYVRHTHELFEEAEALPLLDKTELKKAFRACPLLKAVS